MRRELRANKFSAYCLLPAASCLTAFFLISCDSALIRQNEEQIRQQQAEILRQRKEIEEIQLARRKEEQKRRDCNRAFGDFEKAQAFKEPNEAAALYRQGLTLCPDDEVAHYELGKIFISAGKLGEAEQEFEAALRINPNFTEAKRLLETIRK